MTYSEFLQSIIGQTAPGTPIYIKNLSKQLAENFNLEGKEASAAVSVAVKRLIESGRITDLRQFKKGIYYRTVTTPFGERGIDREKLIADKYILPDIGYETGMSLLHRMGLVTQIPNEQEITTNAAGNCTRNDKVLDVRIHPPKVKVNAENKKYLQMLDALELIDKAPINAEQPYFILSRHIKDNHLDYGRLLSFADQYYNQSTVRHLAHTAGERRI